MSASLLLSPSSSTPTLVARVEGAVCHLGVCRALRTKAEKSLRIMGVIRWKMDLRWTNASFGSNPLLCLIGFCVSACARLLDARVFTYNDAACVNHNYDEANDRGQNYKIECFLLTIKIIL